LGAYDTFRIFKGQGHWFLDEDVLSGVSSLDSDTGLLYGKFHEAAKIWQDKHGIRRMR
jgi:hypothetical protein